MKKDRRMLPRMYVGDVLTFLDKHVSSKLHFFSLHTVQYGSGTVQYGIVDSKIGSTVLCKQKLRRLKDFGNMC
jgi:hypothetical protein